MTETGNPDLIIYVDQHGEGLEFLVLSIETERLSLFLGSIKVLIDKVICDLLRLLTFSSVREVFTESSILVLTLSSLQYVDHDRDL